MFGLNEVVVKIVAFIVACVLLFGWHSYDKHEAIREAVSVSETKMKETHRLALEKAQRASQSVTEALQANADTERKKKDETINRINTKLADALSRLHSRPTRPASLSQDTPVVQACTARELYREDGEFLTREAARAESVVAERDYYYQQYEEVRNKINGTTK